MNSSDDMIYENNIFDRGMNCLLHIACEKAEWMPTIRNNIFVGKDGGDFARLGEIPTKIIPYTECGIASQSYVDLENKFYFV